MKNLFCCPNDDAINLRKSVKILTLPQASDGVCGQSGIDNLPTRIVGGEEASLGEFPWVALLKYSKREKILPLNLK